MKFYVAAVWDEEAKVFYSKSNIDGLAIEAETIDEFENVMGELAPDMITANHISREDLAQKPLRDLISSYRWQPPSEPLPKVA